MNKPNYIASGQFQPFVQRVVNATIAFAHKHIVRAHALLNQFNRTIAGSAINQHMFGVGIALRLHGIDRAAKCAGAVVYRGNNGNFHERKCVCEVKFGQ